MSRPARNCRRLIGRATVLAELDQLLAIGGPQRAVTIAVLAGTAGVGKTALAVHWAHRVADQFPDGQLYVNLRGFHPTEPALAPADAIRGFLDALNVTAQRIPADLQDQAGLYRSLLAGRRMLVVLDNAAEVEQVRPLLPGSAGCVVVATSRNQLPGLVAIEGAQALTLDLFTVADAQQMLANRLGATRVAAEPTAVDEIITSCARLPLALAIVAARATIHPGFSLPRAGCSTITCTPPTAPRSCWSRTEIRSPWPRPVSGSHPNRQGHWHDWVVTQTAALAPRNA